MPACSLAWHSVLSALSVPTFYTSMHIQFILRLMLVRMSMYTFIFVIYFLPVSLFCCCCCYVDSIFFPYIEMVPVLTVAMVPMLNSILYEHYNDLNKSTENYFDGTKLNPTTTTTHIQTLKVRLTSFWTQHQRKNSF